MDILVVARGYPQTHNNMLGIFELDQAIALRNAGHRIAYAAVDIRSFRRKRRFGYNHFVDANGIEVFEMNWPIGGLPQDISGFFRRKCFQSLYPHIVAEFGRPDIVHAHFLKMGAAVKSICRKESLPFVLTEHSSLINKKSLSKTVSRRASATYSSCDSIITVSHSLEKNIKDSLGFDSIVIHNIVNIGNNETKITKLTENKRYKIVSAGNLVPRKGFDVLIMAFSEAVKIKPDMQMEIFGDGPERKNLELLIEKLSLSDRIVIRGRYKKQDLAQLFSDADVFVLASKRETFGVVYIEAMALGLPVIATRCGGPEDFVDDSNGYLVDVDDVPGLANALVKMSECFAAFDRERIKDYAFSHFSPKTISKQLIQVYNDTLAQKGLLKHED